VTVILIIVRDALLHGKMLVRYVRMSQRYTNTTWLELICQL
jgi:hypothetical protein